MEEGPEPQEFMEHVEHSIEGSILRSTCARQLPLQFLQLTKSIDTKMQTYVTEQKEIEDKATGLEKESEHEFAAHQMHSYAVACFQICIVLASISILVDSTVLFQGSILDGVIGVMLMIVGYVT